MMLAIEHAAMAVDGMLIKFLSDHGLDSTPLSEERMAIAKKMAAYAIYTYAQMLMTETADIAFPPKIPFEKFADRLEIKDNS